MIWIWGDFWVVVGGLGGLGDHFLSGLSQLEIY